VKVNSEGRETETGKVIERRSEGDSFWSVPKHGCVVGFIGLGATSQGPMFSACLPSARDRSLHAKPLGTRRGRAKEKSRITAAIDGTVGQHCGKMNLAYHPASPERKVNADVLTFQNLVHIIWNLKCFSQAVALPYHGRPSREMVSLALTFSTSRHHSI
jgi:hypothetical protein